VQIYSNAIQGENYPTLELKKKKHKYTSLDEYGAIAFACEADFQGFADVHHPKMMACMWISKCIMLQENRMSVIKCGRAVLP